MWLWTLCLGMRTRQFRSPFVRSFGRCCPFWWIFFRRLRVLLLLLLLLGLCSRISLTPLFLPLLLSTSRGSRGPARLWLMRMLAAAFLSSGRSDFSFLPPHNASYAVRGGFASGQAVPVNPSMLSHFEKQLKPSYHVGLTIREAATLESLLRCQAEALSHSMWVPSGLLGFVRLQNFAPADSSLFNTFVTSLSKSLAHQASLCASHTAFLVLKRRQFYLSHLPSYFSDVNKRSMLASPAVCSDFLFTEADVACLLSDTQTFSSLRSQQALMDVASRSVGARPRCSSPRRSPARQSPSHRCRESGSPARSSKLVRFGSPAPSSALKSSKWGFRR